MAAAKKSAPASKAAPARKAPARKAPAGKAPARKATSKQAPSAHKAQAKKAALVKKAPIANKGPAKKAAPAKTSVAKTSVAKKAIAKKAPAKKSPAKKSPAKKSPAKKKAPAAKAPARTTTARQANGAVAAPAKKAVVGRGHDAVLEIPPVRGVSKDGIAYTKDFDVAFLRQQRELLESEKIALKGQATRLEDEALSLVEEQEMGDVQFDDEGGKGDSMVVELERDLALSAQARQIIEDVDAALARITEGRYGYSVMSNRPIPRERLEALPWATELVEEKVGGIGRR